MRELGRRGDPGHEQIRSNYICTICLDFLIIWPIMGVREYPALLRRHEPVVHCRHVEAYLSNNHRGRHENATDCICLYSPAGRM